MSQSAYLRHLANFAVVVETGSMSGAAEHLRASPSAMSESVKILENYFGGALLERHRSGVTPTTSGLSVYEHAREMSLAASRALDIAGAGQAPPKIRISMPVELACHWFHETWRQLQSDRQPPDLSILAEDELLDHDRYARDLYIRVSSGALPKNINVLHSHQTKSVFAVHKSVLKKRSANRLSDIQQLPLLCKPQVGAVAKMTLRHQQSDSQSTELSFKRVIYVNDTQTRIAMAKSALGAVGCIYETLKPDISSGVMVPLAPGRLSVPLQVQIASPHRNPSLFVQSVADKLADWMCNR